MALFSERYGYTKPSDVIIRERITPEIQNAIVNCIDELIHKLNTTYAPISLPKNIFKEIEEEIYIHYFNGLKSKYHYGFSLEYLQCKSNEWYKKLDIIELILENLNLILKSYRWYYNAYKEFIDLLNFEFKRLNFGYYIIENKITEVTSKEEIITIEAALKESKNNVREHLNKALELYSKRPVADYRNSIKESISAVEVFCREKTGEDTLGKALNKLESNGIVIHKLLKSAFDKLYAYTNQPDTGVRHALMDNDGDYVPQAEEALFMLVSCSAFINYLNKKIK